MKKITLLKLTLLSTVIFLTACSSKQEKIKKVSITHPVSIYNIMGITEPQQEIVHVTHTENLPYIHQNSRAFANQNLYQIDETIVESEPIVMASEPYISPDIEFISYQEPRTFVANCQSSYSPPLLHNEYENRKNLLNEIEWKAKSFLGTPYVWGATGPNKFDCSGFTQWVYRDIGINIPRVSRDQAKVGQYVRYEDLQRGDMVFFDTKRHRSGRVTHVGIYLGNNNFIHASSAGKKVVIYNFNQKSFYKKRFLWGRRVTNQKMHYASN